MISNHMYNEFDMIPFSYLGKFGSSLHYRVVLGVISSFIFV
jgi:hypothetical protein